MNTCEAMRRLGEEWTRGKLLAELNEENNLSWQFCANGSRADDGTFYSTCQRFMRVLSPESGYYMTEDTEEPLRQMVEKAMECAALVDGDETVAEISGTSGLLAPEGEPWPQEAMEDIPFPDFDMEGMKAMAGRLWDKIKAESPLVTEVSVTVSALARGRLVVNTLGLVRREMTAHYKVMAILTAKGQTEMNNATWRVYVSELSNLDEALFVRDAVASAVDSLDGGNLVSGTYPVVISAPVMAQMLLGFWKVFSGDDILSGGSCFSQDVGKMIGSEQFTLIDGPAALETGLSVGFDDEGTLKEAATVIKNGRFITPLTCRECAANLGVKSSGNAARKDTMGRIIPNALVVAPKILYVEPSQKSFDDLLAGIEDGVYITDIDDVYHAFNFGSGDFSTPCRGRRIRRGKLAEGIRHVSLSDNLRNMFAGIEAVGDRLVFCDMEDMDVYYLGGTDVRVRQMNLLGDEL